MAEKEIAPIDLVSCRPGEEDTMQLDAVVQADRERHRADVGIGCFPMVAKIFEGNAKHKKYQIKRIRQGEKN